MQGTTFMSTPPLPIIVRLASVMSLAVGAGNHDNFEAYVVPLRVTGFEILWYVWSAASGTVIPTFILSANCVQPHRAHGGPILGPVFYGDAAKLGACIVMPAWSSHEESVHKHAFHRRVLLYAS